MVTVLLVCLSSVVSSPVGFARRTPFQGLSATARERGNEVASEAYMGNYEAQLGVHELWVRSGQLSDPTSMPSTQPTGVPSFVPSGEPTGIPTLEPTLASNFPTSMPTGIPFIAEPSGKPTGIPTLQPTSTTDAPTGTPTTTPTTVPTYADATIVALDVSQELRAAGFGATAFEADVTYGTSFRMAVSNVTGVRLNQVEIKSVDDIVETRRMLRDGKATVYTHPKTQAQTQTIQTQRGAGSSSISLSSRRLAAGDILGVTVNYEVIIVVQEVLHGASNASVEEAVSVIEDSIVEATETSGSGQSAMYSAMLKAAQDVNGSEGTLSVLKTVEVEEPTSFTQVAYWSPTSAPSGAPTSAPTTPSVPPAPPIVEIFVPIALFVLASGFLYAYLKHRRQQRKILYIKERGGDEVKPGEREYDKISLPPATRRGMLGEVGREEQDTPAANKTAVSRPSMATLSLARPASTVEYSSVAGNEDDDEDTIIDDDGESKSFWTERREDIWAALGLTSLLGNVLNMGYASAAPDEANTAGAIGAVPRGPARGLVVGSQEHTHDESPAIRQPRRSSAKPPRVDGGEGISLVNLFPKAVTADEGADEEVGAAIAVTDDNNAEEI